MPNHSQNALANQDKPIALGYHFTLYYQCVATKEEFYSSVDEVVQWIQTGPILQPPSPKPHNNSNVSSPPYSRPQLSIHTTLVTTEPILAQPLGPALQLPDIHDFNAANNALENLAPSPLEPPIPPDNSRLLVAQRRSTRTPVPRDLLKPTHKSKVYNAFITRLLTRKQRGA
jgi:hypothetical protein